MGKRIKEWESAIATLNPEVAMKITSKVVQSIMSRWWVPFVTYSCDGGANPGSVLKTLLKSHWTSTPVSKFSMSCRIWPVLENINSLHFVDKNGAWSCGPMRWRR